MRLRSFAATLPEEPERRRVVRYLARAFAAVFALAALASGVGSEWGFMVGYALLAAAVIAGTRRLLPRRPDSAERASY